MRVKANARIERPIVGFHIKDRLGQWLVGENTYLTYQSMTSRLKHSPLYPCQRLCSL